MQQYHKEMEVNVVRKKAAAHARIYELYSSLDAHNISRSSIPIYWCVCVQTSTDIKTKIVKP